MDIYRAALPLIRALPAEPAHDLTLRLLEYGLAPAPRPMAEPLSLAIDLWGRRFPNPVGLAAGFDKDARVPARMLRFGFGFVETGTVTPLPQAGNPKPRLFRLPEDRGVVNRFGFNNRGLEAYVTRLQALAAAGRPGIVGANVGKNKDQADAVADYVAGIERVAGLADYLVVNVSSPNTPGLRDLQRREPLLALARAVLAARARVVPVDAPPLLLKVAPDLSPDDRADIAFVALESGIDGLIVGNTTVSRPAGLSGAARGEPGGLSGRPLFRLSTDVLADLWRLTQGRIPIVGAGGVSSGAEAYAKIRAGASLVQLYTALVYEGPGLVGRIKLELAAHLARDGFAHVADAVGADHR
ncbi:dihydroorotate oxidase A [Stella humosa]|uniref:Dihydroorotate dehydrogenase (quinone) n=1 Tax=Stella humosa TaxID=94 RepID=A0A3N1KXY8_9PROT|nr:quinone-dependent dihydroorotate dehydrogenase [Stella humosa]ROP83168.1 dihydroorotate oxidase A [Stella humosa]BBK30055.1 dihydroorotate dehydrogenase (quinone) [Stella humosa]